MNNVQLLGNLPRDPEVKYTPKGTAVCTFTIAQSRRYKVGEDWREKSIFIDCEAWAKDAEMIGERYRKGSQMLIDGRIDMETWGDKQTGKKRSKLKVVVEHVHFTGKREEPREERQTGGYERPRNEAPAQRKPEKSPDLDPDE